MSVNRDPKRLATEAERRQVYARQHGRCDECLARLDEHGFEVDHIVRHEHGGVSSLDNYRGLCPACHRNANGSPAPRIALRGWQERALADVLPPLHAGRFATLAAAPGAGKTIFATTAANRLLDAGTVERVVVFVPNLRLVEQWADAAKRLGLHLDPSPRYVTERPGYRGAIYTYQALSNPDTVAMIARDAEAKRTFVILDEVHHLGRDETGAHAAWSHAVTSIVGTYHAPRMPVLNASGTPFRSKRAETIGTCDYRRVNDDQVELVTDYAITTDKLIGDGHLRHVTVESYNAGMRVLDLRSGEVTDGAVVDLDQVEASVRTKALAELLRNEDGFITPVLGAMLDRLALQREALNGHNVKGLVVCDTVAQAQAVYELARERYPLTSHLWQIATSDQGKDAHRAIREFQDSRDLSILISIRMVTEGFDAPDISTIAYLSKVSAALTIEQMIARAMRVTDVERKVGRIPAYVLIPGEPHLVDAFRQVMVGGMRLLDVPSTPCPKCGRAAESCFCRTAIGDKVCGSCGMPHKVCQCQCRQCAGPRYRCGCPKNQMPGEARVEIEMTSDAEISGYLHNGRDTSLEAVDLIARRLTSVRELDRPGVAADIAELLATADALTIHQLRGDHA